MTSEIGFDTVLTLSILLSGHINYCTGMPSCIVLSEEVHICSWFDGGTVRYSWTGNREAHWTWGCPG